MLTFTIRKKNSIEIIFPDFVSYWHSKYVTKNGITVKKYHFKQKFIGLSRE